MDPAITKAQPAPLPRLFLSLALGVAALLPVPGLRADGGKIAVDVVVDFGGDSHQEKLNKKIVRPTADHPAYYLPLFVGHRDVGYADFVKKPPADGAVERALVDALAGQGYLIMTKPSPPSLVLAFWWGYMAPAKLDPQQFYQLNPGTVSLPAGMGASPGFGPANDPESALQSVFNSQLPSETGYQIHHQMMSMLAGDTLKDRRHTGDDPEMARIRELARQPIYYILISAFDFDSWLHHKRILIWQAHVSTGLWSRSFDEVAAAMIATAAPLLGRETREPRFIDAALEPLPRVEVGSPVVREYPAAPAKNP